MAPPVRKPDLLGWKSISLSTRSGESGIGLGVNGLTQEFKPRLCYPPAKQPLEINFSPLKWVEFLLQDGCYKAVEEGKKKKNTTEAPVWILGKSVM